MFSRILAAFTEADVVRYLQTDLELSTVALKFDCTSSAKDAKLDYLGRGHWALTGGVTRLSNKTVVKSDKLDALCEMIFGIYHAETYDDIIRAIRNAETAISDSHIFTQLANLVGSTGRTYDQIDSEFGRFRLKYTVITDVDINLQIILLAKIASVFPKNKEYAGLYKYLLNAVGYWFLTERTGCGARFDTAGYSYLAYISEIKDIPFSMYKYAKLWVPVYYLIWVISLVVHTALNPADIAPGASPSAALEGCLNAAVSPEGLLWVMMGVLPAICCFPFPLIWLSRHRKKLLDKFITKALTE